MQHMAVLIFGVIVALTSIFAAGGYFEKDALAEAVLTGLASLIGAGLAFAWNKQKEEALEEERQQAAINRTLMVLYLQMNAALQLMELIPGFGMPKKNRFGHIVAGSLPIIPDYSRLRHDFRDLEFLIAQANPQLLVDVNISQDCFFQMVHSLQLRNDFLQTKLEPAWRAANIPQRFDEKLVRDRLPSYLLDQAETYWEGLEGCVQDFVRFAGNLQHDVLIQARKIHPRGVFVQLEAYNE